MAIEEKDRDDVMDRLLQLGGDKKFLSYDDLNRELPENVVSPDDIEDVLQKLDASNIHVADSDERLIEQAAAIATDDEEGGDEDLELDLSAGALEKTNDPVRLYLREMGVVPLLTREGEVAIAKRIERGQIKTQKAIARSPIAVGELIKIGDELAARHYQHSRSRQLFRTGRTGRRRRQGRRVSRVDHRGHREHPPAVQERAERMGQAAHRNRKSRAARRPKSCCACAARSPGCASRSPTKSAV